MSTEPVDKAGREYWDGLWSSDDVLTVDSPFAGKATRVETQFAAMLRSQLGPGSGRRLLEVGCARSIWLPFFARDGWIVTGLDYSERGCEQAREILDRAGVAGTVEQGDLFDPPNQLVGSFDAVVSFGVVEHFANTTAAVAALSAFACPTGIVLTSVPNIRGAVGLLQHLINPDVLDIHVPLNREALAAAHRDAGLADVRAFYLVSTNFGVANLHGLDPRKRSTRAKQVLLTALARASQLIWILDRRIKLPATGMFAGYVVGVGRRR